MVVSLWENEAAMVKGEADGYMQAQLRPHPAAGGQHTDPGTL